VSDFSPRLIARLKADEGLRLKMYRDINGYLTIGYGHNMHEPITEELAEAMLLMDTQQAIDTMPHKDVFDQLSDVRQEVLINMNFNLGPAKLKGFKRMWVALSAGLYVQAAKEMLDSRWAEQVGDRSKRLAKAMESGVGSHLET
jgi:lysozyme